MMIHNKIIVIGGNHHNTMGLIHSVGRMGYKVCLFLENCEDPDRCYVTKSKDVNKVYHIKKTQDILTYLHLDFENEACPPVILCASDASICLLDSHYDELKDDFLFFNAGENGRINYLMDKLNTFPLAEKCGMHTIKTWHVTDANHLPDDITFPCLTKGNNSTGSSKDDLAIHNSREELRKFLRPGVDYLVQQYIEKDYELNVVGFAYNHGKDIIIPAAVRKIRDFFDRQSIFIRLDDIKDYPELDVEAIKKFVREMGYEGIFSVEYLCKDNKYYFLETNLRNDGCGYLYTATGANYPYLWIKYITGRLTKKDVEQIHCATPTYMMQLADISSVRLHQVGLFKWLSDLLRTRVFFVFSIRDPKPFLYLIKLVLQM